MVRHFALGIVDIPKHDGLRGASLLAGGDHFTVLNGAILYLRPDFSFLDALHAVSAFLQHAPAADRDIRVAHAVKAGCLPVGKEVEIKPSHFVGAVVRAVARADTAVVNHQVEPFGTVYGGPDRAHIFAGGIFTVHAGHHDAVGFRVLKAAAPVRIHPNPLHDAPVVHFLFTDNCDVVLGIAGDHAGIAAHAAIQINRHSPLITRAVVVPGVEVGGLDRFVGRVRGKIGV